mmetsp:Transcript_10505/g.17613  ORF Transcript_10505/g.17613 Transcript_10505/m.17613 type:complete len:89 (+) Transcript_10505:1925-2191(+)
MWTYVLNHKIRFSNQQYDPDVTLDPIGRVDKLSPIARIPITSHICLSEWRNYFFKWCGWGQEFDHLQGLDKHHPSNITQIIKDDYINP